MIKKLTAFALFLGLGLGLAAPQSQALILLTFPFGIVRCGGLFWIFPICLLDEQGSATNFSKEALVENGISEPDAIVLSSELNGLLNELAARGQALKIEPTDTAQSLVNEFESVFPISEQSAEYLIEFSGKPAQTNASVK